MVDAATGAIRQRAANNNSSSQDDDSILFFLHPQGVMPDPGEQAAQAERNACFRRACFKEPQKGHLGNEQSLQRPLAFLPGGRALGVFLPKSLAKEPDKGQIDLGLCRRLHLPCLQGKDDNLGR